MPGHSSPAVFGEVLECTPAHGGAGLVKLRRNAGAPIQGSTAVGPQCFLSWDFAGRMQRFSRRVASKFSGAAGEGICI